MCVWRYHHYDRSRARVIHASLSSRSWQRWWEWFVVLLGSPISSRMHGRVLRIVERYTQRSDDDNDVYAIVDIYMIYWYYSSYFCCYPFGVPTIVPLSFLLSLLVLSHSFTTARRRTDSTCRSSSALIIYCSNGINIDCVHTTHSYIAHHLIIAHISYMYIYAWFKMSKERIVYNYRCNVYIIAEHYNMPPWPFDSRLAAISQHCSKCSIVDDQVFGPCMMLPDIQ